MSIKSKIIWFEPIVFVFFGAFHLHRIWGLFDRNRYSEFWLSVMTERGWVYYALMGILSVLCIAGIAVFVKNRGNNYWWRWFYIFGGGYVLFDLFAIAAGLEIWKKLLERMFDVTSQYWNVIWGGFIVLGLVSLFIGIILIKIKVKHRWRNKYGLCAKSS